MEPDKKNQAEFFVPAKDVDLEFAFVIAHELRAPLAIIKEGVALVLNELLGKTNPKQAQVLTTVMRNINRLDLIINNMLDMSKIEKKQLELKREWVDFMGLVKKIDVMFLPKIREKKLQFRVISSHETLDACVDKERMLQVLSHLVSNAIKFTEKGSLEIRLSKANNAIECVVRDTGIGISRDNLPRVFEKFEQFGWAPGGGEKGMGLGLALTKGLVELHGGRVWVESQLGFGSQFGFSIPSAVQEK